MEDPPSKKELKAIEEFTAAWLKSGMNTFFPGMELYDEEEHEAVLRLMLAHMRKVPEDDSGQHAESVLSTYRCVSLYRYLRFLHTYKGFIQGKLDLTGRHPARWAEYIEKFRAYMHDFESLIPIIKVTRSVRKVGKYEYPEERYEFLDAERMVQWMDRWDIANDNLHLCLMGTFKTREKYLKGLPPKLQKLNFLDFPQEVLEQVYDCCEQKEIVALAHTCKVLYNSGYCHLLKEFRLAFGSYPFDRIQEASRTVPPEDFDPEGEEPSFPFVQPILENVRDWLIQRLDKLCLRPEQCNYIKKVNYNLNPRWVLPVWALKQFDHDDEQVQETILKPVAEPMFKLLHLATRLQSLDLHLFELDIDAIRNLCELKTLQVLTLEYCHFDEAGAAYLREQSHDLDLHVPNLHLYLRVREDEMCSLWHALCFCSSVRNLSLFDPGRKHHGALDFPPEEVWSKFKCSPSSIERLYIRGLTEGFVEDFVEWLNECRDKNQRLALTHLKLETAMDLSEAMTLLFLCEVRSTTMEVLSVEGSEFEMGRPSILEMIASWFPYLEGLTLAIRANSRQWSTKPVVWRGPAWSYAKQLSFFPRLEHFEWNNYIPTDTSTPAPFAKMEQHEIEGTFEEGGYPFFCYDARSFGDYHLNATAFAAHCPTLKTWVANKGTLFTHQEAVCQIRRKPKADSESGPNQKIEVVLVPDMAQLRCLNVDRVVPQQLS